jgi:hypothetical protein
MPKNGWLSSAEKSLTLSMAMFCTVGVQINLPQALLGGPRRQGDLRSESVTPFALKMLTSCSAVDGAAQP